MEGSSEDDLESCAQRCAREGEFNTLLTWLGIVPATPRGSGSPGALTTQLWLNSVIQEDSMFWGGSGQSPTALEEATDALFAPRVSEG